MKRTNSLFLLLPLLAGFGACQKAVRQPEAAGTASNTAVQTAATATATTTAFTNLVWSDEFDGTSVNTANWSFETGGGGWGNNEKEYYQAANATVSNGNLVITAKKQRVKANNYTSARLKTQGKREFTYGRIEARIKLPLGQGLWPAFWMLGANINTVSWPGCGETDIMEHINTENTIYGTIHWDNNGHASYGGNTTTTPADYHVYAVEWDATSMRWYVDNVQYLTADITNGINGTEEFQKPFFILLNMAVGGNWPGQTIDDSKLPASMYIDYVRVYQ
ncbi:glycoside hydrolase family 16 protein [Flavisolibacter nicotianae]|uniref:glycoside hydrolase family 16 protein n=1 Tax=Flavisolibacter nicotianae TaxID=2364882 RepID=UPI000EB14D41|nr:glycoside hydrolase family 16 protein [Flavisolibacter nicotianae]